MGIRFVFDPPVTARDRCAAYRAACERSWLTKEGAAARIGFSPNTVYRTLVGETEGKLCQQKIAHFCGVPREWMFGPLSQEKVDA
jgi:hypothetical protein